MDKPQEPVLGWRNLRSGLWSDYPAGVAGTLGNPTTIENLATLPTFGVTFWSITIPCSISRPFDGAFLCSPPSIVSEQTPSEHIADNGTSNTFVSTKYPRLTPLPLEPLTYNVECGGRLSGNHADNFLF